MTLKDSLSRHKLAFESIENGQKTVRKQPSPILDGALFIPKGRWRVDSAAAGNRVIHSVNMLYFGPVAKSLHAAVADLTA
jgi:hypothetical protein